MASVATNNVTAHAADPDLVAVIGTDVEDLEAPGHTPEAHLVAGEETATAGEATHLDVTAEVAATETEKEIEELRAELLKLARARAAPLAIARVAMGLALPQDLSLDQTAAASPSLLETPELQRRRMAPHLSLLQLSPELTLKRAQSESLEVYKV